MCTLLLTPDFPPQTGGVARYLDAVASALKDTVVVFAPSRPNSDVFDRSAAYKIMRTPLTWPFLFGWLRSVQLLYKARATYDKVIVSHVLPFGTAAYLAKFFTKKPYIVIVHGMDISLAQSTTWKEKLAALVLRNADLVIANSQSLKEEIKLDFNVERIAFVHPSVNLQEIKPPPAKQGETRQPEGEASVRLLTVSRLVPRKGHMRVLEALSRLRERGELPPNVSYTIVGDGTMSDAIERRALELGIRDIVHLKHEVTDEELPDIYRASDIFVMPTVLGSADREGFGIVYLEAASYGLPSIATDQPGVDEAVLDGTTGLLVPDGDIEALARAIRKLALDAGLRQTLGQAGQTRAREEFSTERQAEKIRHLLM